MPSRSLPKTDEERNAALKDAKTKNDGLPVGTEILRAETVVSLDAQQPVFAAKMLLRGIALRDQGNSTGELNVKRDHARTFISHFFQSFNNGIVRGVFPSADRSYYLLDLSSSALPELKNEKQITEWGDNIIAGDPVRVAAGGVAMSNPTIGEFTTVFNAYKSAKVTHGNLKDAYDAAQKVVADLRPSADALILRIWNEVETYYSNEDIESRRRHGRGWGIVYVNLPNEFSITGTVTDTNNNPVDDVTISIESLGVSVQSNSYGEYNFPVVAAGTYEVAVSKEGYQPQTLPGIIIEEGVVKILNIQILSTTATLIANVYGEGQPINGATVTIDELSLSANTNETGQAIINGITPGTWNVTAVATGYQSSTQPATFIANNTENLSFDLIPI